MHVREKDHQIVNEIMDFPDYNISLHLLEYSNIFDSVSNFTDFKNWTSDEDKNDFEYFYFYRTEQLTFLWIIFTMIVLGNGGVLITLMMSKNRKSRMNFFIMQLALADLLVGLIQVLTDIIWRTYVDFYGGNVVCKIVRYLQVLVMYSSTYVLVALSIDRYDAITRPMKFSGSWKRAKMLIGMAWGISALAASPAVFLNKESMIKGRIQCWIEMENWQWRIYMSLVAFSVLFLPAVVISGCYTVIVHTIWTKSKSLTYPKTRRSASTEDDDAISKRTSSRGIIPQAKIKTVKMTFVIVFVFILCWSPYFIYDLLQVFGYFSINQTNIAVSTFIQSLAPLNSAANPFIYLIFSTHLCRTLSKRTCCRWFSRRGGVCRTRAKRPLGNDTLRRTSHCSTMSEIVLRSLRLSNSHQVSQEMRPSVSFHMKQASRVTSNWERPSLPSQVFKVEPHDAHKF
ncbi:cardioacceleratory peptide receptor-like [Limulus polyphemus]|uniref:Cardioacceleratory peptide receptor-like n=1 Tax=Limulus polyphemus TaxID=6850 RepID=A0ABM1B2Y6_LIMPO|nr:cardioacceleratory peptide receptor-like [Limulus polyphemus]